MKRSKAYQNAAEKINREQLYSPNQAVELAKATQVTKFDPTVEVNLRLGVDPRKQDHRQPAERHRQDGPRPGVRDRPPRGGGRGGRGRLRGLR
jgi:large subunit ribosomal protein L1